MLKFKRFDQEVGVNVSAGREHGSVSTCQHGDERQRVVLRGAAVPGLAQQVALQHLIVELLDPGLRENHEDPAALDQTHKLLLQKNTKNTQKTNTRPTI